MAEFDVVGSLIKVALTFGLLFLTLKLVGRFMGPQSGKVRSSGRPVEVVGRTSLGRAAQIVLVRMGERAYALGVSQQGVNLITEIDLDEPVETAPAAPSISGPLAHPGLPARTQDPVSRTTWRDMIESLREKTVRR